MFERFETVIRSLPRRSAYAQGDLLIPDLLIAQDARMRVYYAPFDWANTTARVILLGITPGWTQMELAYRGACRAIEAGKNGDDICREAKLHGSFAGTMRHHLVRMLDAIGLPEVLGIAAASDLFGTARHLLHTASAIRYPVFVGAKNYTGSPSPDKSPLLMGFARTVLAPELDAVRSALIVPLGKSVERVLQALAAEKRLDPNRWLSGFPHPSGANGHRVRSFEQNRESLSMPIENGTLLPIEYGRGWGLSPGVR
jgi:hypothetical protein